MCSPSTDQYAAEGGTALVMGLVYCCLAGGQIRLLQIPVAAKTEVDSAPGAWWMLAGVSGYLQYLQ